MGVAKVALTKAAPWIANDKETTKAQRHLGAAVIYQTGKSFASRVSIDSYHAGELH